MLAATIVLIAFLAFACAERSTLLYDFPLQTTPAEMTWQGGASLTNSFSDPSSSGTSTFSIQGDASEGSSSGRGLESTVTISGDVALWVSWYQQQSCADPGLAVFPTRNYWEWGTFTGRISTQANCRNPAIYGQSSSRTNGDDSLETGNWYTMVLRHIPTRGKTVATYYSGLIDTTDITGFASFTPFKTMTITESFGVGDDLKFGIAADNDEGTNGATQFKNLRVATLQFDPTSQPTSQPSTQPSTQPTSSPTGQPTSSPTGQPTTQPTSSPTRQPTSRPTGQPTGQPTSRPTGQPSRQPTGQPTSAPTRISNKRKYRIFTSKTHPTMHPSASPNVLP